MVRTRNNPLALAVLYCLLERAMHPYEVAATLRHRAKERSVKLNYGALYAVVESLRGRGLILARETERTGRLPERTIYELTDAGRVELSDWLADLISRPTTEYPRFVAALSFLSALAPGQAEKLMESRLQQLTVEETQAAVAREAVQRQGLPRLFWVEEEYRECTRAAEIEYVGSLLRDLRSGALDGVEPRPGAHEHGFEQQPLQTGRELQNAGGVPTRARIQREPPFWDVSPVGPELGPGGQ